ncbi:MAG: hypothetical protein SXQ77_11690 [Halobacteria archaeon]|nr:hypothetical protein [Halobacteria archaeon]
MYVQSAVSGDTVDVEFDIDGWEAVDTQPEGESSGGFVSKIFG